MNKPDILFHGKRIDNGEWAYGLLGQYHEGVKATIIDNHLGVFENTVELVCVDPATVGRYTGHKDINGKMLFEGHIVRCGTGRVCKVVYFTSPSFSGFDLVAIGNFDAPPPRKWCLFTDLEIIGNIHDNPELFA